jgi:hypothetical protein
MGRVLRPAAPGHARFLPNTTVGALLRLATDEDDRAAASLAGRGREILGRAARLAGEMGLPLEVLEVEVFLDGEHAVLHHLRWGECDVRPFVSTLSREFAVHILLTDLTGAGGATELEEPEESAAGCGSCGSGGCGSGGCGSCGEGGCGSCGTANPQDVRAYFAGLRGRMEARQRTPLL